MTALRYMAIMLAAAAIMAPVASAGDGRILAGDDRALWILNNRSGDKGPVFDLVAKRLGAKWEWVVKDRMGRVAGAAAVDSQLHVFFDDGSTLVFSTDSSEAVAAQRLGGGPLAVCSASGLSAGSSVLAVLARAAAANAGASTKLKIMQRIGSRWSPLTTLETVRLAETSRVFAVVVNETLMLLISDPTAATNLLYAWSAGKWRKIETAALPAGAVPIAMLAVDGQLVIPLASGKKASARGVTLAVADGPAGKFTYQPVETDGRKLTWPADNPPVAAQLGKQLALLWSGGADGGKKLRVALGDTAGTFTAAEEVGVFDHPPDDGKGGANVQEKFLWGLMLAILAALLLLRPRSPAAPLLLPQGLRPAAMPRRIMAAVIDLAPFPTLGSLAFPGLTAIDPAKLLEHRVLPEIVVYWYLSSIVAYTLYSMFMEWRFGATLGKMIVKIRVIGYDGAKPNLREMLLRNLSRLIPLCFNPLLPLLVLFPLLNPNRQRLGDLLARSVVIDARFAPATKDGDSDEADSPDEP